MKPRDVVDLLLLAAIWGASFLFMRLGAAEFGAVALTALRVAGAALCLAPLVLWRGQRHALRGRVASIALIGVVGSALPYALFALAALSINAGLSSILNATAPLWGAVVAWLWLGDRLSASRLLGLALGFAGVLGLAWDKASLRPGEHGVSAAVAIAACLAATLCYGIAVHLTKRRLSGVPPLAVAAGTQAAAALALALPALWWWPSRLPGAAAWGSALALSLLCTGVAMVLYFRLIARIGPARAITVTFLIPVFGVLWGAVFLGEAVTPAMLLGGAVVLAGTALATGAVQLPAWRRSARENP
jgi:drug/metabolite transporter (DMT)-like permease